MSHLTATAAQRSRAAGAGRRREPACGPTMAIRLVAVPIVARLAPSAAGTIGLGMAWGAALGFIWTRYGSTSFELSFAR